MNKSNEQFDPHEELDSLEDPKSQEHLGVLKWKLDNLFSIFFYESDKR